MAEVPKSKPITEDQFKNELDLTAKIIFNKTLPRDDLRITLQEKIKNMVALMPDNTGVEGVAVETAISENAVSITFEDISSDFENMPEFEPVKTATESKKESKSKQSLNQKLPINISSFMGSVEITLFSIISLTKPERGSILQYAKALKSLTIISLGL